MKTNPVTCVPLIEFGIGARHVSLAKMPNGTLGILVEDSTTTRARVLVSVDTPLDDRSVDALDECWEEKGAQSPFIPISGDVLKTHGAPPALVIKGAMALSALCLATDIETHERCLAVATILSSDKKLEEKYDHVSALCGEASTMYLMSDGWERATALATRVFQGEAAKKLEEICALYFAEHSGVLN